MDFEKLARDYVHSGCISIEGLAEQFQWFYSQGEKAGRCDREGLIARITSQNVHSEVLTGEPRGKETL